MITVYFTKEFTSGLLKGLLYCESMRFSSEAEAADFIKAGRKGFKGQKVSGGSGWRIVDASYQKYWRH